MRGLKYRGWTSLADYMGGLMVPAALTLAQPRPPVLVPVPLARSRQRERGFNQAELLARAVSNRLGWPVRSLVRRREGGRALAGLGREEREQTACGAFEPTPGTGDRALADRVLLVDDVITTGATAGACAEALSEVGVGRVNVLSFARTDPLGDER